MSNRYQFQPRWGAIAVVCICIAIVLWFNYRPDDSVIESLRPGVDVNDANRSTPFRLPERAPRSEIERAMTKVDPTRDGWTSESASSAIDLRFKEAQKAIVDSKDSSIPGDLVTSDFRGKLSMQASLATVFEDELFQTSRHSETFGADSNSFDAIIASWTSDRQIKRCSFKIVDVKIMDVDGGKARAARTRALVQLASEAASGSQQDDLVIESDWQAIDGRFQMSRLQTLSHERVLFRKDRALFEDVTESVLGQTPGYLEQVRLGLGHWTERLTGLDDMSIYGHHGIAVGDVDGDGRQDLYVCDGGGLPNRLYLQQADGTVRDVSNGSGVDWLESSTSALIVDFDNDGRQDLVVATVAGLIFAAGEGNGKFRIRAAQPGFREAQTLSACDYDSDGKLDLYVCVYGASGEGGKRGFEASLPIPYNDAQNGGRNVLFRNGGNWKFRDVTTQVGLDVNNRRWSFSASWSDFDADGDSDLYVANDFGRNCLYRNEGGRFSEVAAQLGVEDISAGMSVDWGDPNLDGRMDLYVGNMFSAAGNRVTYQRRFVEGRDAGNVAAVRRMARGNTLFTAQADGSFRDDSLTAGVTMGRWSWGSKFVDFNNDGWDDVLVSNGYFTNRKTDDL